MEQPAWQEPPGFGGPADWFAPVPWLCVPASRRVCVFAPVAPERAGQPWRQGHWQLWFRTLCVGAPRSHDRMVHASRGPGQVRTPPECSRAPRTGLVPVRGGTGSPALYATRPRRRRGLALSATEASGGGSGSNDRVVVVDRDRADLAVAPRSTNTVVRGEVALHETVWSDVYTSSLSVVNPSAGVLSVNVATGSPVQVPSRTG